MKPEVFEQDKDRLRFKHAHTSNTVLPFSCSQRCKLRVLYCWISVRAMGRERGVVRDKVFREQSTEPKAWERLLPFGSLSNQGLCGADVLTIDEGVFRACPDKMESVLKSSATCTSRGDMGK